MKLKMADVDILHTAKRKLGYLYRCRCLGDMVLMDMM